MRLLSKFIFLLLINQASLAQIEPNIEDAVRSEFGERDPFRRPKYLDDLEEANKAAVINSNGDQADDRIEAIRRWPARLYKPIAVIWDVQNPKVMILDPLKTMHLLKKNYRIGNNSGIITAINEGEIVVSENGVPNVMKIESADGK